MDWQDFVRGWAAVIISAALFVWNVTASRGKAAKDEQDKLVARMDEIEERLEGDERADFLAFEAVRSRLSEVENTLKHMPTREQLHSVQLSVERMGGDMKVLAGSTARIEGMLTEQRRQA